MNRLAPRHMAGLIMGAWFFATAGGDFIAGQIGALTGAENVGGAGGAAAKELVLHVYTTIGWVAIAIGVVVLVVAPLVRRLMHLDRLKDEDELAGYKEIGEEQAPGLFPQREAKPGIEQI
jgi:POT family proton-dependent oligopeptide transporter